MVSTCSVQGLLDVVQSWGCRAARDPRLVPLALEALVGAVHVLHASRTPPRGPELRALLEGYFRVLNADWPTHPSSGPEEALVALRVSMLGGCWGPGSWGGALRREPHYGRQVDQAVWGGQDGCCCCCHLCWAHVGLILNFV